MLADRPGGSRPEREAQQGSGPHCVNMDPRLTTGGTVRACIDSRRSPRMSEVRSRAWCAGRASNDERDYGCGKERRGRSFHEFAEHTAQTGRPVANAVSAEKSSSDVMCRCSGLFDDSDCGAAKAAGVSRLQDAVQVLRDGGPRDLGLQLLGRKEPQMLVEGTPVGGGVSAATCLEEHCRESQLLSVLRGDPPDLQGLLLPRRQEAHEPEDVEGDAKRADRGDAEGPVRERGEGEPRPGGNARRGDDRRGSVADADRRARRPRVSWEEDRRIPARPARVEDDRQGPPPADGSGDLEGRGAD